MIPSNFPLYKCHKQVRAVQIQDVIKHAHPDPDYDDDVFEASAEFQGGHLFHRSEHSATPIEVSAEWYRKHKPQAGGYYVVYEDGYTSFSPQHAFESGYRPVPESDVWSLPASPDDPRELARKQIKCSLPVGEPTGLHDSTGHEIRIGDIVQQPVTGNTDMHGSWSRMLVWAQGVVPILLYVESETGKQLPFGYLAVMLSTVYDAKSFLWAADASRLRPEEELIVVNIE